MYNYVLFDVISGLYFCSLQEIQNMAEPLDLKDGISLKPWPVNVRMLMDPKFPKATKLPDCVRNLTQALVVSQRLKDFIEQTETPKTEYLPISIADHKGKTVSSDYYIVNPCPQQDCINLNESEIVWSALDTTLISACLRMTIDERKIDPQLKIFRLKHYPTKILFERNLASSITQNGFTGIGFIEIEDMEY